MPDSESGLKSSSLLLAAMRIGVVGNTRAFDSRVEHYWVRIPHPQPQDRASRPCLSFYIKKKDKRYIHESTKILLEHEFLNSIKEDEWGIAHPHIEFASLENYNKE